MSVSAARERQIVDVDAQLLRAWPLPQPDAAGDKEERGNVLVIAGSREMPGGLLLAATATLHAGAGKLTVATAASVARYVAIQLPEARVIELPEVGDTGGLAKSAVDRIAPLLERQDAVLCGPGMVEDTALADLVRSIAKALDGKTLILDAAALTEVKDSGGVAVRPRGWVMTPHAGELASLFDLDKKTVIAAPLECAKDAAARWSAVVALKGATTFIAAPDERVWRHSGGNVGLAISGSGDALAGIIAGLAARGAAPEQAAVWGVALHARAGERLAERVGPIGYLARDLSREIPSLMAELMGDASSPGP